MTASRNYIDLLTRMLADIDKTGSPSLWGDWTRSASDLWLRIAALYDAACRQENPSPELAAALHALEFGGPTTEEPAA